jgi:hypothetical protein
MEEGRLDYLPSDVLYGPHPSTTKAPHEVRVNPIFKKAEFCGACHEMHTLKGFPLFTTYTEWKNSPYSLEEITCQKCHMPEDPMRSPVDRPYKSSLILTAHGFKGGHSVEQVRRALDLVIIPPLKKEPFEVRIDVTNREAGHTIPTGIPSRRVRLEIDLLDRKGNLITRKEKVYQRIVGDSLGRPLTTLAEMFLYASQTLADNRLQPRRTVHEKISFPGVEADSVGKVVARAYYEMGNLPLPEIWRAQILLASATFDMTERTVSPYFYGFIFMGLFILIILIMGLILTRKKYV